MLSFKTSSLYCAFERNIRNGTNRNIRNWFAFFRLKRDGNTEPKRWLQNDRQCYLPTQFFVTLRLFVQGLHSSARSATCWSVWADNLTLASMSFVRRMSILCRHQLIVSNFYSFHKHLRTEKIASSAWYPARQSRENNWSLSNNSTCDVVERSERCENSAGVNTLAENEAHGRIHDECVASGLGRAEDQSDDHSV